LDQMVATLSRKLWKKRSDYSIIEDMHDNDSYDGI